MYSLPLVLLPGTLCDARIWQGVISDLDQTIEVLTPTYAAGATMAEVVSDLLTELPDRFALAGFSLGGLAALELLSQSPDSVDRLALLSSHAHAETNQGAERRWQQVEHAKEHGLECLVSQQFIPAGLSADHPGYGKNAELIRQMANSATLNDFERQTLMATSRNDQHRTLAAFKRSTLIIASTQDQMCAPEKPSSAAESIPAARVLWLEGTGHYITLEQAQVVAAAMATWLEE